MNFAFQFMFLLVLTKPFNQGEYKFKISVFGMCRLCSLMKHSLSALDIKTKEELLFYQLLKLDLISYYLLLTTLTLNVHRSQRH